MKITKKELRQIIKEEIEGSGSSLNVYFTMMNEFIEDLSDNLEMEKDDDRDWKSSVDKGMREINDFIREILHGLFEELIQEK